MTINQSRLTHHPYAPLRALVATSAIIGGLFVGACGDDSGDEPSDGDGGGTSTAGDGSGATGGGEGGSSNTGGDGSGDGGSDTGDGGSDTGDGGSGSVTDASMMEPDDMSSGGSDAGMMGEPDDTMEPDSTMEPDDTTMDAGTGGGDNGDSECGSEGDICCETDNIEEECEGSDLACFDDDDDENTPPICTPCGGEGERCCDPDDSCNDEGTICLNQPGPQNDLCEPCGGDGEPCCADDECDDDLECGPPGQGQNTCG